MEEQNDEVNIGQSSAVPNLRNLTTAFGHTFRPMLEKLETIKILQARLIDEVTEAPQDDKEFDGYQDIDDVDIEENLDVNTAELVDLVTAIKKSHDVQMHDKKANMLAHILQETKLSLTFENPDKETVSSVDDVPELQETIKDVLLKAKKCNSELNQELHEMSLKEEELVNLKQNLVETVNKNRLLKKAYEETLKGMEISSEEKRYENSVKVKIDEINQMRRVLTELQPVSNLQEERKKSFYRKYGKPLVVKELSQN